MKSKRKIYDVVMIALFWSLIIIISVVTLIKKPQDISKNEGRELAKIPDASIASVLNGEYFEGLRDFYTDQLFLKNAFTAIYTSSRLALGAQEVNGVIICKNGALVTRTDIENKSVLQKNLDSIQKLFGNSNSHLLFVAPDSIQVFKEYLPVLLRKSIDKDDFTDPVFYEKVYRNVEAYYYNTDHHWTSAGAFEAYRSICQKLGVKALDEAFFTKQSVSQSFYGSAYRRSALPLSLVTPDEIILYRHRDDCSFAVTDLENNTELGGIYDLDELSGVDPYRVFLGGNYAHISVEHKNEKRRPRMLIIKDSFANSLIPFLTHHYDLEIVDPRYASAQTANSISLGDFDRILVLCSNNTLSNEESYGNFIDHIITKGQRISSALFELSQIKTPNYRL